MKIVQWRYGLLAVILVILALSGFWWYSSHAHSDEIIKGSHGGRLLTKGNVAVEMTIFERGMPPHFRIYTYQNDKLISPKAVNLSVTLKRFSDEINKFQFEPMEDYLQSKEVVEEPHSFDVSVALKLEGKDYQWHYESIEGRVTIAPEVLKAAGIQISTAGPRTITQTLSVVGKITPNRDAMVPVYPRYSGIVKELRKNLGDTVEKGETVAIVESNDSLQPYSIVASMPGTVVQKYAAVGEMVKGDKPIYEIADLNTVWVDLNLYRKDAPLVQKDMPVTVSSDEGKVTGATVIHYVSPLGIESSQTVLARAVLSNKDKQWIPGMYVNALITTQSKTAAVAVPLSALQKWRDGDVVFIQRGNTFEAAPLSLGIRDAEWVEVLEGLNAGQAYVSENSFFLKADLGKSSAGHDH